jgi:cobalamin biosynthesis Mg chelatase CobN
VLGVEAPESRRRDETEQVKPRKIGDGLWDVSAMRDKNRDVSRIPELLGVRMP